MARRRHFYHLAHMLKTPNAPACVTYDLSRLQNHASAEPLLLTLNGTGSVDAARVLQRFTYHHPAYTLESVAAQLKADEINGRRRTFYCGAYWGYGFHEDGVNSALAVANRFGIELDSCSVASTPATWSTTAGNR